jgi:hypothetical protein
MCLNPILAAPLSCPKKIQITSESPVGEVEITIKEYLVDDEPMDLSRTPQVFRMDEYSGGRIKKSELNKQLPSRIRETYDIIGLMFFRPVDGRTLEYTKIIFKKSTICT